MSDSIVARWRFHRTPATIVILRLEVAAGVRISLKSQVPGTLLRKSATYTDYLFTASTARVKVAQDSFSNRKARNSNPTFRVTRPPQSYSQ